jgi:hypothetical protein
MKDIKEVVKNTAIIQPTPKKKKKGGPGRPFKPGQSGNPAGKPSGTLSLTSIIKRKLAEIYDSPVNKEAKKATIELLADQIIKNGIENGSERTQEKIWAYLDGHPKTTIDIGADKDSLGELTDFFRAVAKQKQKK